MRLSFSYPWFEDDCLSDYRSILLTHRCYILLNFFSELNNKDRT